MAGYASEGSRQAVVRDFVVDWKRVMKVVRFDFV